jgi:hypothetical protein
MPVEFSAVEKEASRLERIRARMPTPKLFG